MGFRSDLRRRTVAVLSRAALVPNGHVHNSRKLPTERAELDAISVFTLNSEQSGPAAWMSAPQFDAETDLSIEVAVDDDDDEALADKIDTLCERIVEVLLTDAGWVAAVQGVSSINTAIRPDTKSDKRTAGGTITMTVTMSQIYEPVVTDDFESTEIKTDVIDPIADPNKHFPGPDGRIEVRQVFGLPQD
ncbi:MAG: hypothetical protein E6Q98_20020 [Rhodospirillaceae bacterium]|nr:MAG: hypothetical protein E6Q98_20020 [Rhodospirillaceae bacterium]